jgi:hypothetical protein
LKKKNTAAVQKNDPTRSGMTVSNEYRSHPQKPGTRSSPLIRMRHSAAFTIVALLLSSCFSIIPEPKYIEPPKRTAVPVPAARPYLPDGWADITARAKRQDIKLWLINREYSGTMVLRELQSPAETQKHLLAEEINTIAMMSLRAKVPDNHPEFRVTRVPTVIDMKRNFSSYAYTEKGLLRRVIVFKKQGMILELELLQEQYAAEFDALTNDLVSFATTLYER